MSEGLYLIERVDRREADVQVIEPDGTRGVILGGFVPEWLVLLASNRRLVAVCHSEEGAERLVGSLEMDAEDFAREWMRNPANDWRPDDQEREKKQKAQA